MSVFSVDKDSVVIILCNCLQINNEITLVLKKKFIINVKIAFKIFIQVNFKTTLQMDLKKLLYE